MRLSLLLASGVTLGATLFAAEPSHNISAASILSHVKVLASDEFEGRAPGTPGEEKTIDYLVTEFKKLGLEPGNPNGTFIQDVPLVGITATPHLTIMVGEPREQKQVETVNLTARVTKRIDPAHQMLEPQPIVDYVGFTTRVTPHLEVKDSDIVFVGYGVVAPEFGWDDYKGVDVRGKTVVMLINDPPVTDPATGKLDPKIFGGAAMTYYGRWTYKFDIAAEKGAAACLIVHETGPAAYPFAVVVNSNTRENMEIRSPDGNAGHVAMKGWMTIDFTKQLFAAAGKDFASLKKLAATRDFRPVELGAKASFTVDATLRNVDSHNVVARMPGADSKLRDEFVIYSAHWDHLGRDPKLTGDQIYNGAADNAAGTAVLLELAKAYKSLPASEAPRRSILFLSVTAEEKGLLGSRYYAENPLYPLNKTVANINMDGANQFGRTSNMETIGFGASTIDDVGIAVANEEGRTMGPDSHPERGSYYRSDHFEFAKVGVPSYYPKPGKLYIGESPDYGEKLINDYIAHDYHQVSDEVKPNWTFEGAAQDTEFLFEVGYRIANNPTWPEWRAANEFKAKRDAMLGRK